MIKLYFDEFVTNFSTRDAHVKLYSDKLTPSLSFPHTRHVVVGIQIVLTNWVDTTNSRKEDTIKR